MFTSIFKIVLQKRNFPSSHSLIRFISTDSTTNPNNSFTISYLTDSCGLSQQKASSLSKNFNLQSSLKPDSVLTLLRNNGFSNSHISKLISSYPHLLLCNVDNNLKPKFEFFNSKGFSVELLSKEERILTCSLEKNIIPGFEFLKSLVGTDEKVMAVLKRDASAIRKTSVIAMNVALLRDVGVPSIKIGKLLCAQPRVLSRNAARFSKWVEEVKKMKFDPLKYTFLTAIHALNSMSRSSLEAKFEVYKRCGWSEDEVQSAFRKLPYCMTLSEENIMSKFDYFVNKMGYASSYLAKAPCTLLYSFERIVPRCSVIQLLYTTGQVKEPPSFNTFLPMSEASFLKKYLTRYEKKVPELMDAYQQKAR